MAISRRRFLEGCFGVGVLGLAGCNMATPVSRQRWYLFGTLVDVTVVHPDRQRVAAAMSDLSSLFQDIHHNLHAWKPGRLMDVNNAIARGEAISVDAGLAALIGDLQDQYRRSDGRFNPAVGELIGLWGFHGDSLPSGRVPTRARVDALVAEQPSPLDLQLDGGMLRSRNPHVQLDLGGYGKGYALDLGMALLARAGLQDVIINAGGDLNVSGSHHGRPWLVGVRDPQGPGAIAAIETQGTEAIYTSGNYERYLEYQGQRYAHIIDPRDGMPVQDIVSATVIHDNGARADSAATALTVAGETGWQAVAESLGIRRVMVVDRQGRVWLTRPMAERVRLKDVAAGRAIVV